jgi:DNA adenine methylase
MMFSFAAGPVLKWAGGKQGIADTLVRHFPAAFACYYEPFVGGGSVLLSFHPAKAVIGDLNDWLIDTYRAIREDQAAVAQILDGLVNTKAEYLRIRRIRPESLDLFHRAAHLIFLNKTCFRGLFRVNRRGQFNVPYGQYDRRYYDPENLRALAAALARVEIRCGDFELCLAGITANDFAYLDPPYYKLGGYSDFNRYTKGQFREKDHLRMASVCRELHLRGVRWAVSNSDTAFVRSLFSGFRIVAIENRREINLNSEERTISELLIMNYDPDGNRLRMADGE